jgi:hypothetical protein
VRLLADAGVVALIRRANESLRLDEEAAASPNRPQLFLCECGEDDCIRKVWLRPAAYDERRNSVDDRVLSAFCLQREHSRALRSKSRVLVRTMRRKLEHFAHGFRGVDGS